MFSYAKAVTALTLLVMLSIDKTDSVCCDLSYVIHHVCLGLPNESHIPIHLIWDLFFIDNKFKYWIRSENDVDRPKCVSRFCEDGSETKNRQCGVGKCNYFGCKCEGGCRKNNGTNLEESATAWRASHNLLIKKEHKLKGTFE